MTPPFDHEPPLNTRRARRVRIAWRITWMLSAALFVASMYDLTTSILEYNALTEAALQIQRAQR